MIYCIWMPCIWIFMLISYEAFFKSANMLLLMEFNYRFYLFSWDLQSLPLQLNMQGSIINTDLTSIFLELIIISRNSSNTFRLLFEFQDSSKNSFVYFSYSFASRARNGQGWSGLQNWHQEGRFCWTQVILPA